MSRDELALLFRHAGLDVAPETIDELHGIYGHIEQMIERVNQPLEDDPMVVFTPLESPP
jgi:hypothetical protein